MFFVTADHKLYGPYWHIRVAADVRDRILTHLRGLGLPAVMAGSSSIDSMGAPIIVGIVERQMIHEPVGWKDYTLDP